MTEQEQRSEAEPPRPPLRQIDSQELFNGSKVVLISHDGVEYRLHITRNNKLILQK